MLNISGLNFNNTAQIVPKQVNEQTPVTSAVPNFTPALKTCSAANILAYQPAYKADLSMQAVQQKYAEVSQTADSETRVMLSQLLKTGVLLDNNSNDGTSVLDN